MTIARISELRKGGTDISLDGPSVILPSSTNTFTITDYDSFSVYSATISVGTVSLSDETLTVVLPAGVTGVAVLTIKRNNSTRKINIGIGVTGVVTPSIVSPISGATGVSRATTLQGTAFSTAPIGAGTQTSSRWQVATDAGFVAIVQDVTVNTGDMTRATLDTLESNTTYYARVMYLSTIGDSNWSSTTSFTTINQTIATPTVTSSSSVVSAPETPSFNSSAFTVTPVGSDSHVSSTWIVRKISDNSIVWQLNNSIENKTSVTIPRGILQVSTQYNISVRYNGGFGSSSFSSPLVFNTANAFVPDTPGTPFGGGYYVGRLNVDDGNVYALIISPRSLGGQNLSVVWSTYSTDTQPDTGAYSLNNGRANTDKLLQISQTNFPAASFCASLTIGGYTDWYLPAKDEAEMIYRYFKSTQQQNTVGQGVNNSSIPPGTAYTTNNPSQTPVFIFQNNGSESTGQGAIFSSTQSSTSKAPWSQRLDNGTQLNSVFGSGARAVRRVRIS
jgi:hypothetical protein